MDRYYKIAKDSETGKKLAELVSRLEDFKATRNKFADKYGVRGVRHCEIYLASVASVVFKDETSIDKDSWKRSPDPQGYIPKNNPKNNELKKDWQELQSKSILRYKLDEIVGGTDQFVHCGFHYGKEDYFFIYTSCPEKYDFPSDVIEISNLEYLELTKQK